MFRYKSKYEKVVVLPIWIVKSNVSSVGLSSEISIYIFSLNIEIMTRRLCCLHTVLSISALNTRAEWEKKKGDILVMRHSCYASNAVLKHKCS